MASAAGDPWAYTPPLSLWCLVEENVSPEEQDEIKSMLGTSLVETTQDLHNEVKMLLEIWQDYKEQTESENHNAGTLAEPPYVRERLIQEICFLAESVHEKSASKGLCSSVLLSRHNSQVLEYAEGTKRCGSSLGSVQPLSARSSEVRQTPLMTSECANSHFALDSTITEEVSSANDKLNYLQFDEVCNRLRETLAQEMEQLEADVAFLHSCLTDTLDDPSCGATSALSREPTLTDLKEERSLLERDLMSAASLPDTPPVQRPPFLPASPASGITMPTLGPISTKPRPVQATSTPAPSRTVPLKASHPVAQLPPPPPSLSARSSASPPSSPGSGATKTPSPQQGHVQNLNAQLRLASGRTGGRSGEDHCRGTRAKGRAHHTSEREGSAFHGGTRSAARVKVVSVGSVLEPRVDSAGSQMLMPTPPPVEEAPPVSRPNSAQRFRRMVMSYRETS